MRSARGLAVVAAAALGATEVFADVRVGDVAPPVTAKTWLNSPADGPPTPERLKGKVVMVEFWGTWCNPCVQAMPHVQRLWDRYRDRGLVVLAVSYEEPDVLRAFLDKNGYTMPCGADPDKTCIGAYAFKSWPHTVLVGKDGKLAFVGDPLGVEPAIENALGLESGPATLLTKYLAAAGGASKGREFVERLVESAPTDFDLKTWAASAGGVADARPALAIDGAKHLSEYAKLAASPKADAAKKQAELDWLAAGGPEKFDLGAWARDLFGREFPLTAKELAKLLDDKRFDDALDAMVGRNPSPDGAAAAAKCIPFAVFCSQHAADARTNAKKALMASLWVFAGKQPKDDKAFWQEINVTAWREGPDHAPTALQIGGEMVSSAAASAYVDRQLARFRLMDAFKAGKPPALAGLKADAAKERDALTKELRQKYD